MVGRWSVPEQKLHGAEQAWILESAVADRKGKTGVLSSTPGPREGVVCKDAIAKLISQQNLFIWRWVDEYGRLWKVLGQPRDCRRLASAAAAQASDHYEGKVLELARMPPVAMKFRKRQPKESQQ